MHVDQKVNIHNRFDIEVRDAKTGKLKKEVTAFNIVLNSMWTRLCGGSTYFVNIHFGTGTGTLDPTRTALFSHLSSKTAVNEELIKALPVSTWKRKIVLNPEEFVGQTITEVGIAWGATASYLLTHAMLKDAEGNPISITKTDTDVITIYATVFITFAEVDNLIMLGLPDDNKLINYLFGGTFPTGSFGLTEAPIGYNRLGSTANVSWTSDLPNKKRKTNVQRFGATVGNGNVKALEFSNVFALEFPAVGIFTGQPYTDVPVGVGDGVTDTFLLPSANINAASLALKLSGVLTVNYTKILFNGHMARRSSPSSVLPDYGNGVALTPDGLVMAVAHDDSPYITTYDWMDNAWIKRPDPTSLPPSFGYDVALTPDGLVMAVGHLFSPYITTYDWVTDAWVKRPDPTSLPAGTPNGVAITPDGLVMAVAHDSSPGITTYDWVTDAWVKRPDPTSLPNNNGESVALTPDGLVMVVGHNLSPYITTYDWVTDAWVKRPNPTSLPTGTGYGIAITPDGLVMAIAHSTSPYITTYDWVTDDWVKRPDPTSLPAGNNGYGVALTPDGLVVVITHSLTPFISAYDWMDGAWIKRPTPTSIPSGAANGVAFTSDGLLMAVAHDYAPYISIYRMYPLTFVKFTTPPTNAVPITSDYTVEGVHKTDQYVSDASFAIQFGEGV